MFVYHMLLKGDNLGELEEMVLLAVAGLEENAYGVSVMHFISNEAGRSVNISALHEVLRRLENKGYLRSKVGGATAVRGGRSKRFFVLTASGRKILDESIRVKLHLYSRILGLNTKGS